MTIWGLARRYEVLRGALGDLAGPRGDLGGSLRGFWGNSGGPLGDLCGPGGDLEGILG